MASACYNSGLVKLGTGLIDWDTDTIKLALLTSSYTPNIDSDEFWDDVSANEVSASGSYPTGGVTLTASATQDNTNDRAVYDATDLTSGSSITSFTGVFRYGVVYKDTGVDSTSPLICVIDFNANGVSIESGTLTITFDAAGIFNLTNA